jgi:hypothetical protein
MKESIDQNTRDTKDSFFSETTKFDVFDTAIYNFRDVGIFGGWSCSE